MGQGYRKESSSRILANYIEVLVSSVDKYGQECRQIISIYLRVILGRSTRQDNY